MIEPPLDAADIDKPERSYTKRQTSLSLFAAWVALFAAMWLGKDMALIVVPIMATLIAALLGVYQAIGHFDLRALASAARPRSKSNRPRDHPEPQS